MSKKYKVEATVCRKVETPPLPKNVAQALKKRNKGKVKNIKIVKA